MRSAASSAAPQRRFLRNASLATVRFDLLLNMAAELEGLAYPLEGRLSATGAVHNDRAVAEQTGLETLRDCNPLNFVEERFK